MTSAGRVTDALWLMAGAVLLGLLALGLLLDIAGNLLMKKLAPLASLSCLLLLAGGCASTDPSKVLDALGRNYAHCERTVTYSAAIGPLNPGSGATISGTVRCQPAEAAPGQ